MKYLFFDTETTGLARNCKAPASASDNWPHIVQVAWQVVELGRGEVDPEVHLVRPDGFEISADSTCVHGITTEYATEHGVDLRLVMDRLAADIAGVDEVVAHNMDFDLNVTGSEFLRLGMGRPFAGKRLRCTKEESTDFCRLPGNYGNYKWPSLGELHHVLFDEGFEEAHEASADMRACMRCFFELQAKGVIG